MYSIIVVSGVIVNMIFGQNVDILLRFYNKYGKIIHNKVAIGTMLDRFISSYGGNDVLTKGIRRKFL